MRSNEPAHVHPHTSWMAYVFAVIVPLGTLAVRLACAPWVGERPFLIAFLIPVILSAYVGGPGPGIVATVVGAAGTYYSLTAPLPDAILGRPVDVIQWLIFLMAGLLVSALSAAVDRLRRRDAATIAQLHEVQTALRENEELFAKAFQLSPDCVAIVRLSDRTVIRANEALSGLWGRTSAEVTGKPMQDFSTWLSESERTEFMQILEEKGEVMGHEATVRFTGGRVVTLIVSARRITLGGEDCVLSVMHDVTASKATEAARQMSEVRYRALFEYAPDGILIGDPQSIYLDANPSICRMLGYTRKELIGRSAYDIIAPSEASQIQRAIQTLKPESDYHQAWHFRRKDGSIFEADVLATVMPDGNLLGVIRDITDRRRGEVATAQLAGIVASSDDAIVGKNLQSVVTSWNAGAEKVFGYAPEEMIGHSIVELIPGNRRQEEDEIMRRIKLGESVRHFETQRVRKDGSIIDVSVTVSPIRDAAGRVVGASKVARDISERRRTEERLAAERTLLRTLIDLLPDSIYVKDAGHRFVLINDTGARYIGAKPDEMIGKDDADFFPAPQAAQFRAREREVLQGEPLIAFEHAYPQAGGRRQILLTTKVPLRDHEGKIVGLVGTSRDITESKQAEEAIRRLNVDLEKRVEERTAQLAAANQELEAFSYSVSHDLRAPLRAVDGFSQAVLEDFGPLLPADGQRQLLTIRQGAQNMGKLIDDLLSFSRLSRQALTKQALKTETLVRSVLADLEGEITGRSIEINVGELPDSAGDPALLKQVWINLLSNALKYTRRRTPAIVTIGCDRQGEEEVFFVRDNGTGFDMQYAGKLFGVFQRLHRAEDYEGTGVGLAIVQRIVSRHGGRVWAEGELERGATFYFNLENKAKP